MCLSGSKWIYLHWIQDQVRTHLYSIAPAEGQKPISIMTDSSFEEMSNPDKFCFGTGGFHTERPRKISYRKYFNQRLLDVDGRFARDMDYLQGAP